MARVQGLPIAKEAWEEQYRDGRWSYLSNLPEMARYPFIAAHIMRAADRPRVLDVGGGAGILYTYLDDRRIDRYVCLDLAESAFADSPIPRDRAEFISCDIEKFQYKANDRFTSVVFNEVLYYTNDPIGVLSRAADHVDPGGLLLVSMFHEKNIESPLRKTTDAIWREIDQCPWPTIDCTALTNIPRQSTWIVRALQVG